MITGKCKLCGEPFEARTKARKHCLLKECTSERNKKAVSKYYESLKREPKEDS